jgi:hypothetical protein
MIPAIPDLQQHTDCFDTHWANTQRLLAPGFWLLTPLLELLEKC